MLAKPLRDLTTVGKGARDSASVEHEWLCYDRDRGRPPVFACRMHLSRSTVPRLFISTREERQRGAATQTEQPCVVTVSPDALGGFIYVPEISPLNVRGAKGLCKHERLRCDRTQGGLVRVCLSMHPSSLMARRVFIPAREEQQGEHETWIRQPKHKRGPGVGGARPVTRSEEIHSREAHRAAVLDAITTAPALLAYSFILKILILPGGRRGDLVRRVSAAQGSNHGKRRLSSVLGRKAAGEDARPGLCYLRFSAGKRQGKTLGLDSAAGLLSTAR